MSEKDYISLRQAIKEIGAKAKDFLRLAAVNKLKLYCFLHLRVIDPSIIFSGKSANPTCEFILPSDAANYLSRFEKCEINSFIVPEENRSIPDILNMIMVLSGKDEVAVKAQRRISEKVLRMFAKRIAIFAASLRLHVAKIGNGIFVYTSEETLFSLQGIFNGYLQAKEAMIDSSALQIEPRIRSASGSLLVTCENPIEVGLKDIRIKKIDIKYIKMLIEKENKKALDDLPEPSKYIVNRSFQVRIVLGICGVIKNEKGKISAREAWNLVSEVQNSEEGGRESKLELYNDYIDLSEYQKSTEATLYQETASLKILTPKGTKTVGYKTFENYWNDIKNEKISW